MDKKQIVRYIDDGANFYISLFGNAAHMEITDNGFYSCVKPKEGQSGITFVYNIRLENLPDNVQTENIEEIKALGMPVWLDLLASDKLYYKMYGNQKAHGLIEFTENDEFYMARMPKQKTVYPPTPDNINITAVKTPEEFGLWANIVNTFLNGGYLYIHPVYHYPLCKKGLMNCYILYDDNIPSSVCAVMNNDGIASLEFVTTIPELRRRGLAQTVCSKAIDDTFVSGAKFITLRAVNKAACKLYGSLGFKIYNYVI